MKLFKKIKHIFRDSKTGRFVTALFAKDHPETTEKERTK